MTWPEGFEPNLAEPLWQAGLAVAILIALLVGLLIISIRRAGWAAQEARNAAAQIAALGRGQAELSGAQTQTAQMLDSRVSGLRADMGQSLSDAAARTAETFGEVRERLAAIDRAQGNIERLSEDVLGLTDILSNKQARGAFGEIQLQSLVRDALPPGAWRWQATLGNGTRADCIIDMPDPPGPLVIDAKFPLEAYHALRAAETERDRKAAASSFRAAIRAHIRAISTKYILPGETSDGALMFLPSEAVYAELHANFSDLVREGFAARVWVVSPTTCMAVLNTLRAVLKDARMREEAGAIRDTIRLLHRDVDLVSERVARLKTHIGQAHSDLDGIGTAATRAARRAKALDALDFGDDPPSPERQNVKIIRP